VGTHCEYRLLVTGEQNQRNWVTPQNSISDGNMMLIKVVFLLYKTSCNANSTILSRRELLRVFINKGRTLEVQRQLELDASTVMEEADENQDGSLDFSEFFASLLLEGPVYERLVSRALRYQFGQMDQDDSGMVDIADLMKYAILRLALKRGLTSHSMQRLPGQVSLVGGGHVINTEHDCRQLVRPGDVVRVVGARNVDIQTPLDGDFIVVRITQHALHLAAAYTGSTLKRVTAYRLRPVGTLVRKSQLALSKGSDIARPTHAVITNTLKAGGEWVRASNFTMAAVSVSQTALLLGMVFPGPDMTVDLYQVEFLDWARAAGLSLQQVWVCTGEDT
jgi:Ca2+-binding EF-hand superfamily protein